MKEKKIKKTATKRKRRRQMYSDNHEIGSFFYGCKSLSVHDDASIWFVHGCGWMFFCCSLK